MTLRQDLSGKWELPRAYLVEGMNIGTGQGEESA